MHKTVVIGLAARGQVWLKALDAHERFQVAGLVDNRPDALAEAAAGWRIPDERCHASCEEAFASGHYDTAVIVVPHHLHYPVAMDALSAGLHVLVEKPLTLDMAQAQDLVRHAEERKRTLSVGQNYRFKPSLQFASEAVRSQRLGCLSSVQGVFHRHRPPRAGEASMPFPLIFTQAIHHLDWLLDVLPSPVDRVHGAHRRVPWTEWENPSLSQLLIQCEDGTLASYQGSYESQGEHTGYTGHWRLECERGDLLIDREERVWQVTAQGENRELAYEPSGDERSSEARLLDEWHEALTKGTEPSTSGRRNLATLELLFKCMGGLNP